MPWCRRNPAVFRAVTLACDLWHLCGSRGPTRVAYMKARPDSHRRTRSLYWLRVGCLVGLAGLTACQDSERIAATAKGGSFANGGSMPIQTKFE